MLRKTESKLQQVPFASEEQEESDSKVLGNDIFNILQSNKDFQFEYQNVEELEKARDAYCLRIVDSVLKERSIVEQNDKKIKEEQREGQVTLDKVFKLARDEEEEEEDEESESEQEEEEVKE